MFAGPAMNFVLGFVLIYVMALAWGLPNLHPQRRRLCQTKLLVSHQN